MSEREATKLMASVFGRKQLLHAILIVKGLRNAW